MLSHYSTDLVFVIPRQVAQLDKLKGERGDGRGVFVSHHDHLGRLPEGQLVVIVEVAVLFVGRFEGAVVDEVDLANLAQVVVLVALLLEGRGPNLARLVDQVK